VGGRVASAVVVVVVELRVAVSRSSAAVAVGAAVWEARRGILNMVLVDLSLMKRAITGACKWTNLWT
jgi:hypothetical protein